VKGWSKSRAWENRRSVLRCSLTLFSRKINPRYLLTRRRNGLQELLKFGSQLLIGLPAQGSAVPKYGRIERQMASF
jgi:hypothetical protein